MLGTVTVLAGVPQHFSDDSLFSNTIKKVLHKYDHDENLQFDIRMHILKWIDEYSSVLFDVYHTMFHDHLNERIPEEELMECVSEFIENKGRIEITYNDLLDDLHVYFTEFLKEDPYQCHRIRYYWVGNENHVDL